jgi:hypothetical protein
MPAADNPDSTRAGRFFTGAFRFTIRPTDRLGFTAQYQDLSTTRNYADGPAGPGSQSAGSSLSRYLGKIQTANARLDASLGRFQHFDAGYESENEDFQNRLLPPAPATRFFTDVTQRSNAVFAQNQLRFMDGRLQFAAGYRAQFYALDQPVFQPLSGAPFTGRTFAAPPTAQTGDASASYTFHQSSTKFRAHAAAVTARPRSMNASASSTEDRATRSTATRVFGPIAPVPSTVESIRRCGTRGCGSRPPTSIRG